MSKKLANKKSCCKINLVKGEIPFLPIVVLDYVIF